MEKQEYEYGIKYKVIKLSKTQYILFPVSLEKIEVDSTGFFKEELDIPYLYDKKDLRNRYVIDKVFAKDELEYIYEYAGKTYLIVFTDAAENETNQKNIYKELQEYIDKVKSYENKEASYSGIKLTLQLFADSKYFFI